MSNTFFRFKEFTVNQDETAMKVCTDACLFGAWVADNMHNSDAYLLDIGSGTGLLSLMIAQKTRGRIDAIEIDEAAVRQSEDNFQNSPWKERISVIHSAIQDFDPGFKYDIIFSNPPFYENDLKSVNDKKNIAHHESALGLVQIIHSVKRLLVNEGKFAILLPERRSREFERLATRSGWTVLYKATVKQSGTHNIFRCMYIVLNGSSVTSYQEEEIIIKNKENNYTEKFYELLKDYYLFEKK